MEPVIPPPVIHAGTLSKLGGGAGGHKVWRDRYFVFSDHLYYYTNKAAYEKDAKSPQGRISLNAYYVSRAQDDSNTDFEFCVNAYPKVRGERERPGGRRQWTVCG